MLKDAPSDKLANAIRNVAADQRAGIADAELAPPGDRHEELALRISLDQDVLNQRHQPQPARVAPLVEFVYLKIDGLDIARLFRVVFAAILRTFWTRSAIITPQYCAARDQPTDYWRFGKVSLELEILVSCRRYHQCTIHEPHMR
ncbi:hypothetical protein [Amycolatopsis sp. NPDC003731]